MFAQSGAQGTLTGSTRRSDYWERYFHNSTITYRPDIGIRDGMLWFRELLMLLHPLRINFSFCAIRLQVVPTPKLISQLGVALTSSYSFKARWKSPDIEGSGQLKTQPNGIRTAFGAIFRSVSKFSRGRNKWNRSWPKIASTSLSYVSSEQWALTGGNASSISRHRLRRSQHEGVSSRTASPQKWSKSHPNEQASIWAQQFE